MIWLWTACEPVDHFLVRQYLIDTPAYVERCYVGDDGETQCFDEAIYGAPLLASEEAVVGEAYSDTLVPPAGAVILVDVQAVDEAGNVSSGEGECP